MTSDHQASMPGAPGHDQDSDAPQDRPPDEVHGGHDGVLDSGDGQGDQDAEPPTRADQP